MKFAQFASLVRLNTNTNSTTFTDADMLIFANVEKDKIAQEIVKQNKGLLGGYAFCNLEAGVREYPLPADMLTSIERVEVSLDGTTWKVIDEIELALTNMPTNETDIQNFFKGKDPAYDRFRGSLFIFSEDPIIDVSYGIKLWGMFYPTDFVNFTDNRDMSVPNPANPLDIGFPRAFHEVLATGVGIRYKQSKDKPMALTERELSYRDDLQNAIVQIRNDNFSVAIPATEPQDNGFDY